MTSSYCLSSSRNRSAPDAFLAQNSNLFLPRQRKCAFANETQLPKKEALVLKPQQRLPKPSLYLLRPRNSGFIQPYAALSSFAEGQEGEGIERRGHQEDSKSDDDFQGMAQAFHISSRTAAAISVCIAVAALTIPFFMKSLSQGVGLKIKLLSYATLLFGFYMAWNIGANDVANAMGTSVGSGALSLRQAVMIAGVLEFCGALLMGTHVTSTMQKGILSCCQCFQWKGHFALCWASIFFGCCWHLVADAFPKILSFFSGQGLTFKHNQS